MAACNLLAEPRSAGNEDAWNTLVTKFPSEEDAAVSAAAAAMLASDVDVEDGNASTWLSDDEYAPKVLFGVISSRSAPIDPRKRRWSIHTPVVHHPHRHRAGRVRPGHDRLLAIDDEPDASPPEMKQLFLQSSVTALGGKRRPVCVGMAWRRFITAGAMRQWQLRLAEASGEVRRFGVAVPGGVKNV